MPAMLTGNEPLKRLFAGLTEQTFTAELGIADPPLIDYLANLLVRFVRLDNVFAVRNPSGQPLVEVAEMLIEAEEREAGPQREIHRHIGDFTLFWLGVFPESLKRLQAKNRKDSLIDYQAQGKRSYWIASEFDQEPYCEEAGILRRLSEQFEVCSLGLNRVRGHLRAEQN